MLRPLTTKTIMFSSGIIENSGYRPIECPCRTIYALPCICGCSGAANDPDEIYRVQMLVSARIAALAGLNTLLPDSGVELFKQYPNDAFTTFTLFPELPEELRIMVWRAAFPRNRVVQVELSPSYEILHSHTPQPITLQVNRESRTETFKFYVPLLDPYLRRPILFHPALDTVYFHRRKSDPLEFMQRAEYITSRSIAGISRIQSLKIPKVYFGGRMQGWIKFGLPRRSLYGHGGYLEPDRGGLRFFHGLEELILVANTHVPEKLIFVGNAMHQDLNTPPDEVVFKLDDGWMVEEYQNAFRGFFGWEKEQSPSCKIPEVVVKQGKNPRHDRWYLGRLSECLDEI